MGLASCVDGNNGHWLRYRKAYRGLKIVQSSGFGALIIAGLFVLAYFFSRQHTVSIASKGGEKIQFFTKGLDREDIIGFVDKVEQAMNDRRKSLQLVHSF